MKRIVFLAFVLVFMSSPLRGKEIPLDESLVRPGEWGYHPADGETVAVCTPSFVWRPMKDIVRWELEIEPTTELNRVNGPLSASIKNLEFNTWTPFYDMKDAVYRWKYRGFDKNGNTTNWSKTRTFTVPENMPGTPLPRREDLLGRIPDHHPRVLVRPDAEMEFMRRLMKEELSAEYKELVKQCDKLLENPPDTTEPPLYKDRNLWKDELDTWWGNRRKTIAVLENAALLAFVWNLDGNEKYAELSKKLLMDAARWNPKGSTGYRYNDEAGMPYAYHFARTYSFLNKYLSEEERHICRDVMKIRGGEMYEHLCPRQFWTPYESHQNRAWHFLGEVGIAFYGEIPEAGDWIWFAMNKFLATYPVWSDDDGGWHEGVSYWASYQIRFCWWADAMLAAFDIDAFDKPYYSQIGYYPMYLMPPGKIGGNLGDLNQDYRSTSCLELVDIVAMQSDNPYWRWYVDAHETYKSPRNYYTFIRKARSLCKRNDEAEDVGSKPPTDLPKSKLFRGTGIAALNTSLFHSNENVQVQFKSAPAPFGNHSHGYDANNSYVFSAWNENLLINTGRRDYYGSPHHRDWMWSTRSENNITVDGVGQMKRSAAATGEIVHFETATLDDGTECDIVVGEAAEGYRLEKDASKELKEKYPDGKVLERFRRSVVFIKPDVLVVYDKLVAAKPARFEYRLHAQKPFQPSDNYFPDGKSKSVETEFAAFLKKRLGETPLTAPEAVELLPAIENGRNIAIRVDKVACRIDLPLPEKLNFTQTNRYDPMPQEKIKIREWHLTVAPPEESKEIEFLMIARPWRVAETENVPTVDAETERTDAELILRLKSNGPTRTVRFFTRPDASIPVVVN